MFNKSGIMKLLLLFLLSILLDKSRCDLDYDDEVRNQFFCIYVFLFYVYGYYFKFQKIGSNIHTYEGTHDLIRQRIVLYLFSTCGSVLLIPFLLFILQEATALPVVRLNFLFNSTKNQKKDVNVLMADRFA